jgi:hypothetical protein
MFMAQKEKVIFDTNVLRNEMSVDVFLGNRAELNRFSSVADIIIPEIVLEEIREQKHKRLLEKQSSFLENVFHRLRGIDEQETKDFNIEAHIENLENDEEILYSTIRITDYSVLPKIKDLAIKRQAPFSDGKDDGFKDAYLYFTILEFVNITNEKVYFVTEDKRLAEAFENISNVQIIKDFEDFQKHRSGYFKEEYFVGSISEHLAKKYAEDRSITLAHIRDAWLNINYNWVVKVAFGDTTYHIEVDFSNKEIVGSTYIDFDKEIDALSKAGSFERVHDLIEKLGQFTQYFSDEEVQKIIKASVENDQIYWIAGDEDVIGFAKPLFESKLGIISEDVKEKFREYYE